MVGDLMEIVLETGPKFPLFPLLTFLEAFRRFAARRSLPARLLTDNANTFKAAAKEVKNIMRSADIQRQLATRGV